MKLPNGNVALDGQCCPARLTTHLIPFEAKKIHSRSDRQFSTIWINSKLKNSKLPEVPVKL